MDQDIQEMFRRKNREILIHNLELDIDRNVDILMDSLTNMFNLQFDIAIKNIFSMYKEELTLSEITKTLLPLKNKSFTLLANALENKKDVLLHQLEQLEFEKEQMEEYYQLVFRSTDDVVQIFDSDELDILKKDIIQIFGKKKISCLEENELDIIRYRIRDYIMDRLFGKLEDRVQEELFIRDNNLANKAKESYEKFQELEQRTTNK